MKQYVMEIKLTNGQVFNYSGDEIKDINYSLDGKSADVAIFDPETVITRIGLDHKLGHPKVVIQLLGSDNKINRNQPFEFYGTMQDCYSNYNDLSAKAFEVRFKVVSAIEYKIGIIA